MFPVGIRQEDLSEMVAAHQLDNLLYSCGVQFVEDIVEQEQRTGMAACLLQEIKLSQFESNEEGLVLPL